MDSVTYNNALSYHMFFLCLAFVFITSSEKKGKQLTFLKIQNFVSGHQIDQIW